MYININNPIPIFVHLLSNYSHFAELNKYHDLVLQRFTVDRVFLNLLRVTRIVSSMTVSGGWGLAFSFGKDETGSICMSSAPFDVDWLVVSVAGWVTVVFCAFKVGAGGAASLGSCDGGGSSWVASSWFWLEVVLEVGDGGSSVWGGCVAVADRRFAAAGFWRALGPCCCSCNYKVNGSSEMMSVKINDGSISKFNSSISTSMDIMLLWSFNKQH